MTRKQFFFALFGIPLVKHVPAPKLDISHYLTSSDTWYLQAPDAESAFKWMHRDYNLAWRVSRGDWNG